MAAATTATAAPAVSDSGLTREQRIEALLRVQDSLLSGAFLDEAAAGADGDHAGASGLPRKEQQTSGAGLRRCRPWSRDDMLERARSFRIGLWKAPLPGLRPLECARHGWFAADYQTLGCSCGARLVFTRPEFAPGGHSLSDADVLASADGSEPASALLEQAVVARVVQSLRTGHKPECPWRDSACPATFLGVPPLEPKATLNELQRRVAGLTALPSQQIPRVVPLGDLGVSAEERRELFAALGLQPSIPDDSPHVATATLALFGWSTCPFDDGDTGREAREREDIVLSCDLCFRRVGCWQFQRCGGAPASPRPQKRSRVGAAETSQASAPDLLDPIEEHRSFCPYIDVPKPSSAVVVGAAGATPTQSQPGFRFILGSLRGQPGRIVGSGSNDGE